MTIKVKVGLPTILAILFVILKLTNTISWSWLWVLSPLWIWTGFVFLLFAAEKIEEEILYHRWSKTIGKEKK